MQLFTWSLPTLLSRTRLYWDSAICGVHGSLGVSSLFDLQCMLCGLVLIGENLSLIIKWNFK